MQREAEVIQASADITQQLLSLNLPETVIRALSQQESADFTFNVSHYSENASILFLEILDVDGDAAVVHADDVSLEKLTDRVRRLNEVFSALDLICFSLGVEKIKTIGPKYMVGCAAPSTVHSRLRARPCRGRSGRCRSCDELLRVARSRRPSMLS